MQKQSALTISPRCKLEPAKLLVKWKITNTEFAGTLEDDGCEPADCTMGCDQKRIVHTHRLAHFTGLGTTRMKDCNSYINDILKGKIHVSNKSVFKWQGSFL